MSANAGFPGGEPTRSCITPVARQQNMAAGSEKSQRSAESFIKMFVHSAGVEIAERKNAAAAGHRAGGREEPDPAVRCSDSLADIAFGTRNANER